MSEYQQAARRSRRGSTPCKSRGGRQTLLAEPVATSLVARLVLLVLCSSVVGCSSQCGKSADLPSPWVQQASVPAPVVYVSNEGSGDISVVDTGDDRELGRIAVGKHPGALRLSRDEKQLYVVVGQGSDAPEVAVLDLTTEQVVRRLASGPDPLGIDLAPDGTLLFVVNGTPGTVSVVEVATGKVLHALPVGGAPEAVAAHPNGPVLYVTSKQESRLDVVDVSTREPVVQSPVDQQPRSVILTPTGSQAYVANELAGSITIIDGQRHEPQTTIKLAQSDARPLGLVLAPDAKRLFVSTGAGHTVVEIDLEHLEAKRTFDAVGERPSGLAITPDAKKLYSANGLGNDVSVVDVDTGKVRKRVKVGSSPSAVVLAKQHLGPKR